MTNRITTLLRGITNKEIITLMAIGLFTMLTMGYINSVQGLMYKVSATDIIPHYTYQGISVVLDPSKSFEDIEGLNLLIEDTDIVAVYSNEGANGNFMFQYMVNLEDWYKVNNFVSAETKEENE